MIHLRPLSGAALILALASAPLPGQSTPGPPANLLVDGSFESEGAPAWFAESWRRTFRDYATDPGNAHDGRRSAVIRIDGPADDAMLVQLVAVKPRTRYRLAGWAMTSRVAVAEPGGSTGANLSLPGRAERSESLVGDHGWTLLGFEFETGQEPQVQVAARLGHHSSTVTGTAWFDDLSMVELGPATGPTPAIGRPVPSRPLMHPETPSPSADRAGAIILLVVSTAPVLALLILSGWSGGSREPEPGGPSIGWVLWLGLGLIVAGSLILPAAILGLLGIPMVLVGPGVALAAILMRGPGRADVRPAWPLRLLGALIIGVGCYGLAIGGTMTALTLGDRDGARLDLASYLSVVGPWLLSGAAVLLGHRLRSGADRRAVESLGRAIGWAFVASAVLGFLVGPGLPRSL
jgi:hypothetical protein